MAVIRDLSLFFDCLELLKIHILHFNRPPQSPDHWYRLASSRRFLFQDEAFELYWELIFLQNFNPCIDSAFIQILSFPWLRFGKSYYIAENKSEELEKRKTLYWYWCSEEVIGFKKINKNYLWSIKYEKRYRSKTESRLWEKMIS